MSGNDASVYHALLFETVRRQLHTMLNDEEDPAIRRLIETDDTFSVETYLFLKKDCLEARKYGVGLQLLRAVSDLFYQQIMHSTCMCIVSNPDTEYDTQYSEPGDRHSPSSAGNDERWCEYI